MAYRERLLIGLDEGTIELLSFTVLGSPSIYYAANYHPDYSEIGVRLTISVKQTGELFCVSALSNEDTDGEPLLIENLYFEELEPVFTLLLSGDDCESEEAEIE